MVWLMAFCGGESVDERRMVEAVDMTSEEIKKLRQQALSYSVAGLDGMEIPVRTKDVLWLLADHARLAREVEAWEKAVGEMFEASSGMRKEYRTIAAALVQSAIARQRALAAEEPQRKDVRDAQR